MQIDDVEFSLSNLLKVLKNALTKFETMPQIVHFFITNMLKVLRKCLPEWNKTKFETMPQISTFSSHAQSAPETLARVK